MPFPGAAPTPALTQPRAAGRGLGAGLQGSARGPCTQAASAPRSRMQQQSVCTCGVNACKLFYFFFNQLLNNEDITVSLFIFKGPV